MSIMKKSDVVINVGDLICFPYLDKQYVMYVKEVTKEKIIVNRINDCSIIFFFLDVAIKRIKNNVWKHIKRK